VQIEYSYKLLDYMPLPNSPVYKRDKKDYTEKTIAESVRPKEKTIAESVRPIPEDDDDDRTLMGGDPTQLPKGFLEDAVFLSVKLILDSSNVHTENDLSINDANTNGPGIDEENTITSSQQPAASSFEEVEPDSEPIIKWSKLIAANSELHHSLVQNEMVDENNYDLEDVTPHTLSFDRIFITSLNEKNQLQPVVEFAYRLIAEEVETPSETNSDNASTHDRIDLSHPIDRDMPARITVLISRHPIDRDSRRPYKLKKANVKGDHALSTRSFERWTRAPMVKMSLNVQRISITN
jgi:hypothetical protein